MDDDVDDVFYEDREVKYRYLIAPAVCVTKTPLSLSLSLAHLLSLLLFLPFPVLKWLGG